MTTVTASPPMVAATDAPSASEPSIVIEDRARIPAWVRDLDSFRRWARSGAMPERGRFAWLKRELWVDLSMEQVFSHSLVKSEFNTILGGIVRAARSGYLFPDGTLFSNPSADLSTEADAMFATYETIRSGRLRLIPGAQEGYVELEGSPDMAMEIISPTSVRKDTQVLRDLYWLAGVAEYWLVDARGRTPVFTLLRRTDAGYETAEEPDGWRPSAVFGRAFRLTTQTDPLGHPQCVLEVRP